MVVGDRLSAIGAVGLRRTGAKARVTTKDLWHLGSCTKAMTATLLGRLGDRLAERHEQAAPCSPVRYFWPGVLPRNIFFLLLVLLHGLRRLIPPY